MKPCKAIACALLTAAVVSVALMALFSHLNRPHLSVVVSLRNDNYGGKAFHRFKHFARNVDYQAQRTGVRLELVVVEWNPPSERQSIARELELSKLQSIPSINIITVPHSYHQVLTHANRRDMYEFIAKNVGIRRAQGKWILTTNGDVILSDAAWDFLASNKMKDSSYYRVGLQNSGHILPEDIEPSKIAKTLHDDVTTIFGKHQTFDVDQSWSEFRKAEEMMRFWNDETAYVNQDKPTDPYYAASGDFILMSKKNWHALRGFDEEAIHTYMHWDSQMLSKAQAHGLKEEVLLPPIETYHMWHFKNQWKKAYAGVTTNLGALNWQHKFMKEHGDACSFNHNNWGINTARFDENHLAHGAKQNFFARMMTRIGRGIHELVDRNTSVPQCQHLIQQQRKELVTEGTAKPALEEKRSVLSVETVMSSFLVDAYAIEVSNTTLCQDDTQTITWSNATEENMWVGIWQADGEGEFLAWIDKHPIAAVNDSYTYKFTECASMEYIAYLNIGNFTDSESMNDTMPVAHASFVVFELPDCVNATTPPTCPAFVVTPSAAPTTPTAPTAAPPVPTAAPVTNPTEAPASEPAGLSSGAIAGIVIGALVGILLLGAIIAALYYFCIRRASYDRVS